ncbi:MAG: hypothetical protein LQ350_007640 [Teloschistes chrysophthalmus]|nr:MAG: hypothetical protein LQ350_007640 [Niorma chrysophthalma]
MRPYLTLCRRLVSLKATVKSHGLKTFVPDTSDVDDQRFAAQVHLDTKFPTLSVEEIDHHFQEIACSDGFVTLRFAIASAKQAALDEIGKYDKFYLITSHATCNEDGERNLYLVSDVVNAMDSLDLLLCISRVDWKGSMQTVRIDFGKSSENYFRPGRGALQKRQDTTTSEAASTTVFLPIPPSSKPTATTAHHGLNFSYIGTPLLPPSFPGVDSASLNAPFVPEGYSVQCKNCTFTGIIDILHGSVSGNATNPDQGGNGISFDQGSFTFEANGFFAHIELETTLQPSADLLSFEAPMPSIGIPGFQIPGIGIVGPIFKPAIALGTQISSELKFTYALPFSASVDNIALTLSASFRPRLLLGISLLGPTADAGAGVFLNLPTISTTISQVAHVNQKCEPVPISSGSNNDSASALVNGVLEDIFGSLTHVEDSIELGFGVFADFNVKAFKGAAVDDVVTVFNTSFPGPTACLSFDGKKKTLGPVKVAAATTKGGKGGKGASATGSSSSGAGSMVESPTASLGRMSKVFWALLGVGVFFLGL